MSSRGKHRHASNRSRNLGRPLVTTVAAIGGTGLVLTAPAAALLANPGQAQAAPVIPTDLFGCLLSPLGGECLAGDNAELRKVAQRDKKRCELFLSLAK